MKQKRVGRRKFESLLNAVPMAAMENDPGLVSLIRKLVQEEVQRIITRTDKPADSFSQSLEEIVQEEVEKALAPVAVKPMEPRQRPTYAAVTRKPSVPIYPPVQPMKTDVWRTADDFPACFDCGCPGHVVRYYRDRKAAFDSHRARRQNLNEINAEEDFRSPNLVCRSTPIPNLGRSPTPRFRSPWPYRRSSQSPSHRNEKN
ncbi:hypothetical protein AVEN_212432-1 [Araneus ventricosus]|uniref:CCHC-type domain-containing protein n=1 Tax=Araneus ventricosus TaxID=182803 RepID=A0A4Y2BZL0_ARAVE|nr:hypothetical protein AVEN_212432-1 [Araneus ventricosus]